jgi:Fe-S cluster assembly iron-binding protein IscA
MQPPIRNNQEAVMFDVSEKATEKIKELLGQRKNASPIRILLVEAA